MTVILLYSDAFGERFNFSHSLFLLKMEGNENAGPNNCTSFFTGSFHTWIFIKYFYATKQRTIKNSLEWIQFFIMKFKLIYLGKKKRLLPTILCIS